MQTRDKFAKLAVLAVMGSLLSLGTWATAESDAAMADAKETVLHSFGELTDGANPSYGALVADTAGNLYGTTYKGGVHGYGTVFELMPKPNGEWSESVLYSFRNGPHDGAYPAVALIFDHAGNLYGTTTGGGNHPLECGELGCGTVFELMRGVSGSWSEKVLYRFCSAQSCADGFSPQGPLLFDAAGNLDGTTFYGGEAIGTVFRLTPGRNNSWTENVLYNFCTVAGCADGGNPSGTLAEDANGNIYGTTQGGGSIDYGTAFELMPGRKGQWTETVLVSFTGQNGLLPIAGLIFGTNGNLYGTAAGGGAEGKGAVFELSASGGTWTERLLHTFHGEDGSFVYSGLVFDATGNLYGTTLAGGSSGTSCESLAGCGTVFELEPKSGGTWTGTVPHRFEPNAKDGNSPFAGLILKNGTLYGTTYYGGKKENGTVFEIVP